MLPNRNQRNRIRSDQLEPLEAHYSRSWRGSQTPLRVCQDNCQWSTANDTEVLITTTTSKQAPFDSVISGQPSGSTNDNGEGETRDRATELEVVFRRFAESPSSSLKDKDPVHTRSELSRNDTDSQPQIDHEVGSKAGSVAVTPFGSMQRSFTFEFFRSIAREASNHLKASFNEIGRGLNRTWTGYRQPSHRSLLQRNKHLGDRLRFAVEHSPLCNRDFLPNGTVQQLVTSISVDEELARWRHIPLKLSQRWRRTSAIRVDAEDPTWDIFKVESRSTSQLLRKEAEQTHRRLFAILALIERPTSIWDFVNEGICDRVLPELRNLNGSVQLESHQLSRRLRSFRGWSHRLIDDFLETRWMVLSPSFCTNNDIVEHHVFSPHDIIPITSWTTLSEKGACGKVYKATVHTSHHAFEKDVVAIKHLHSKGANLTKGREDFMNESSILRSLTRAHHMNEHLISLLATFERSDNYYLIFPLARCDLEDFWENITPEPGISMWLIHQCRGLAQAMSFIHHHDTTSDTLLLRGTPDRSRTCRTVAEEHRTLKLLGRHGDIKPSNILWFPQEQGKGYGTLKITDFGLARFTPTNMPSRRVQGFVPNSVTYRSPECDVGQQIGAHCDVWALGCVFLVFITWFFGGHDAVEEFTARRQSPDMFWAQMNSDNFFSVEFDAEGKPRAKVKVAVKQVSMPVNA